MNKPALCQELEYKLAQDVLNKTLIKLSKYLELDEVKQAGVHPGNVHKYVVPFPFYLVANYPSKLRPCRLVVAPNCPNSSTRLSINDSLHSGLHQLPAIRAVLLKFRCALSFTLSDLSAYYKRNILSPESALLSAIWLQASDD